MPGLTVATRVRLRCEVTLSLSVPSLPPSLSELPSRSSRAKRVDTTSSPPLVTLSLSVPPCAGRPFTLLVRYTSWPLSLTPTKVTACPSEAPLMPLTSSVLSVSTRTANRSLALVALSVKATPLLPNLLASAAVKYTVLPSALMPA